MVMWLDYTMGDVHVFTGSNGRNRLRSVCLLALFCVSPSAFAVDVLNETFNDSAKFTTSSGLFSDGAFDYLGLSDGLSGDFGAGSIPSGLKGYGGFTGSFLSGMDLDGEGAALPVVIEWNGLNINGLQNLEFSGDFAEFFDAPGDIDFDDFILVEARIDGGAYIKLIEFRLDELEPDNFNGIFSEDTDGDGRGDGAALGSMATNFAKPISGSGTTLDLRLTVRLNAGDEDFGVDNFRVVGVEAGADPLIENFDNDSQFSVSSIGFFSDGDFDFLGIANGAGGDDFGGGTSPVGLKGYNSFVGGFLTGMDLDGEGAALPIEITWSGLNISGLANLEFSGDFAEFFDAPGDIDFDDFIRVEASIDGGAYMTVVEFRLDEAESDNFNGVFREDTNLDGRGEGTLLSGVPTTVTKLIPGSGSSMKLRLVVRLNAGDEDFAVDNFRVTGVRAGAAPLDERFDDTSNFAVSSIGFFSDGGFDYLGLSNGAGAGDFGGGMFPLGIKGYTGFTGSFLTGMDLDGEGANLPIEITWTGLNIAGLTDLVFSGDFAEFFDSPGDIDFDDFIRVEASIDGGAYVPVVEFRLDENEPDNFNGIFREDTDGDGRGDGVALGNSAQRFTKAIGGSGSSMDLRLIVRLNAGDEDFGVDNFLIEGNGGGEPPDPEPQPQLILNEILADPAGDLSGDANGDGVRDAVGDEFVELINTSGADLDIGGWQLLDGAGIRHTFPAGTVLADQCGIVVFGGGDPSGSFGGTLVQTASTGALGLNNSGDQVTVLDATAQMVIDFTYGAEGGGDRSLTRDPDITGGFIQHPSALQSPGLRNTLDTFSGCPEVAVTTLIHAIQGSGAATPLLGQTLNISAIVTQVEPGLSGFYVQEEDADADADPATSEGIFIFAPGAGVAQGDLVEITGTANEFFDLTQLNMVSDVTVVSSGNVLPTASILNLPVSDVGDFEAVEGMRVNLPQQLVVTDTFNLARFGEFDLAVSRLFNPTHLAAPGVDAGVVADLNDRSRIRVDDGFTAQNLDPTVHPAGGLSAANTVRAGDSVSGLSGVMTYSFSAYEVLPVAPVSFNQDNPRPVAPQDPGGSLKVATANLLNYFVTLDDGLSPGCGPTQALGCRGADSVEEFQRQSAKLVAALNGLDADIVGLVEIENCPAMVLSKLVNALNAAAGAGTWGFVDTGPIGDDAIRVGYIYKTATVAPTGPFAILTDPIIIPTKNRVPLAQTFTELASGESLTLAVNHFKSKGSACDVAATAFELNDPDVGDGQGNCNLTRTQAAQALATWLATDPTGSGDPDFMILGDLNAYAMEDPITTLQAAGYTDLTNAFLGAGAYSFSFGGEFGYLDYALSSATLTPQVTGLVEWHINADEVRALDYNTEFKSAGQVVSFFDPGPYRSSDHDPLIVGLNLSSPISLEPISDLSVRTKATKVQLNWSPVAGAVAYNIYRQAGSGSFDLIAGNYQNDTVVYLDTIASGTTYTYYVEWVDASGNVSEASNQVTAAVTARRSRR